MTNTADTDRRFLLGGLAGAAGVAALAQFAKGGPLSPPAGTVASTGKTLSEVEPRTAVQSLPSGGNGRYVISAPGSYYLTGDIAIPNSSNAIVVQVSGVTIDLMGFGITAPALSSAAVAVAADAGVSKLVVQNGRLDQTRISMTAGGLLRGLTCVGGFGNSQVAQQLPGTLVVQDCTFIGTSSSSPAIDSGGGGELAVERCVFTDVTLGVDVRGNTRAAISNCSFMAASFAGVRFVTGGIGTVKNCTALGCANGFINSAGGVFFGNVTVACTTPYTGVANTSTTPATAGAWMNLAL